MSTSLVVAFVLVIMIVFPLLLSLVRFIRGCREVNITRQLKKDGQHTNAQIKDVDIISKMYGRGHLTYGKVEVTYHVNEQNYEITQTISKDFAMHFLRGQTATQVLFLPEQPQIARLAQARADYVTIEQMSLGIALPGMLVGGLIAVAALLLSYIFNASLVVWLHPLLEQMGLWQVEFWLDDSRNSLFLPLMVFFVAFVLFAIFPWLLVDKLIRKQFLAEERTQKN